MNRTFLLSVSLFVSVCCCAQRIVKLRNLWARPQVNVLFGGYKLSFTIRDINRAIELLNEIDNYSYGRSCDLDTSGNYTIELYSGTKVLYHNQLQPMMQYAIGSYLITARRVEVTNRKQKKLGEIILDVGTLGYGEDDIIIQAFDPANHNLIFWGKMPVDLYNKDLGIDYW